MSIDDRAYWRELDADKYNVPSDYVMMPKTEFELHCCMAYLRGYETGSNNMFRSIQQAMTNGLQPREGDV